jgi:hypothetical protein
MPERRRRTKSGRIAVRKNICKGPFRANSTGFMK